MRLNPLNYPRKVPRPPQKGVVTICGFFGGAKAHLTRYWINRPATINFGCDNQRELKILREAHPEAKFLAFPMGEGATSWSLQPQRLAANSTFHGGFGARLELARLAAMELVQTDQFQDFCESLPDEILNLADCDVELIEFHGFGSLCGAACAAGSRVIIEAMIPHLLKVGCPVTLALDGLGADAFLGLAPRARVNAAAALLSHCAFTLDQSPGFDLVPKYLYLHEQPPFQDDVERRERYLMLDTVAMHSAQMQDYIDLIRPNHSADNLCGNILSREVDFMEGLDAEQDIASSTALNLRNQLLSQIESVQPDPLLLDLLRWQDDSVEQSRATVDEVFARMRGMSIDRVLRSVMSPSSHHHFRIFAVTAQGGEFLLERLSEAFAVTPGQLDEYLQRLRLLLTFQAAITAETVWVDQELAKLRPSVAALQDRFAKYYRRFVQGNYLLHGWTARSLNDVALKLRQQSDLLNLREAEADALSRAEFAIEHELRHHLGTLQSILKSLDRFVPRGSLRQIPNYVVTRTTNDMFSMLIKFPDWDAKNQVEKLCSAASQLLPEGLAKIVGATSDRLEDIAEAVVNSKYHVLGPPHGGRRRKHRGKPTYALPPADAHTEAVLPGLIRQRQPKAKVVFNDTLEFGATVSRIHFRRFSKLKQVFDGIVEHDLITAMTGDQAPLNSSSIFRDLQALGGQVTEKGIVFSSTPLGG